MTDIVLSDIIEDDMARENNDFCRRIYGDINDIYSSGFRETTFVVPVVDRQSNRMTLGYNMGPGVDTKLPMAPHRLKLDRHPIGFFFGQYN